MLPSSFELYQNILACPHCGGFLEKIPLGAKCCSCQSEFSQNAIGQLDLRLKKPKKLSVSFQIAPSFEVDAKVFDFLPMDLTESNTSKIGTLDFMSRELPSYVHDSFSGRGLMLDLGCGDTKYRTFFEQLGYAYVGLDYGSDCATFLGDAHVLPFKDESFELLFSRSVFEHLQHPIVAVNEAYRVLKRNCTFIGSIAFLEPFHGNSFYHPTHYGIYNYFKQAGFEIEHISPNAKWDVLTAQANMALFPKMPKRLANLCVFPLKLANKTYWKIGQLFKQDGSSDLNRLLWTTGSYEFVVKKK
jgi:SAM-dependent methyltransferase